MIKSIVGGHKFFNEILLFRYRKQTYVDFTFVVFSAKLNLDYQMYALFLAVF